MRAIARSDIVTLAKALGDGFPIGAMLAGRKVPAECSTARTAPRTAAPRCCRGRAALANLASSAVRANMERQAAALRDGLARIDQSLGLFAEVRGCELMLGALLAERYQGQAGANLDHAAVHGLLLLQGRMYRVSCLR